MKIKPKIDLTPYFKINIGKDLTDGAVSICEAPKPNYTRFFRLTVIGIDEDANTVFFEGWSSKDYTKEKTYDRYHGVTSVLLDGCESVVQVQFIGASQLAKENVNPREYLTKRAIRIEGA